MERRNGSVDHLGTASDGIAIVVPSVQIRPPTRTRDSNAPIPLRPRQCAPRPAKPAQRVGTSALRPAGAAISDHWEVAIACARYLIRSEWVRPR